MKIPFQDFKTDAKQRRKQYQSAFDRVLDNGWYILGPEVEKFEQEFAQYLGSKYCIGVANGLEALQISLMALEIKKGDEVITTPLSAVATTLAILAVGATPVFVDTDENGMIDLNLIPQAITKKTKAILPVHLYGNSLQMDLLKKICKQNNLLLIEDAAQAHGTEFKGKKVGTFGELGCFSFYPTKNLGAMGDAGAIVTNSLDLAQKCRTIRDYGQKSKYVHTTFGLNSRLDEFHAAILREKLRFLDADNKEKNKLADLYFERLKDISQLEIILPIKDSLSCRHLMVIKTKKRNQLQEYLEKQGIASLVHYPILIPDQPFLINEFGKVNLPIARRLVKEILSLPAYPQMNTQQLDYVVKNIINFFEN